MRSKSDKAAAFLFYWKVYAPQYGYKPVEEFEFSRVVGRRHQFDFAWVRQRVAVEINGNAWHVRGGGRHGKDKDLEKLNLAMELGWRVFQYTPAMLERDPAACVEQVARALKSKTKNYDERID